MGELVLDADAMRQVADDFTLAGGGVAVVRPGVGACGCAAVAEAFGQSFSLLSAQWSNVATSYTNLGTRGREAVAAMQAADAQAAS